MGQDGFSRANCIGICCAARISIASTSRQEFEQLQGIQTPTNFQKPVGQGNRPSHLLSQPRGGLRPTESRRPSCVRGHFFPGPVRRQSIITAGANLSLSVPPAHQTEPHKIAGNRAVTRPIQKQPGLRTDEVTPPSGVVDEEARHRAGDDPNAAQSAAAAVDPARLGSPPADQDEREPVRRDRRPPNSSA